MGIATRLNDGGLQVLAATSQLQIYRRKDCTHLLCPLSVVALVTDSNCSLCVFKGEL